MQVEGRLPPKVGHVIRLGEIIEEVDKAQKPSELARAIMEHPDWPGIAAGCQAPVTATPAEDYHEDMGAVLWWRFPVNEPPYAGSPLDSDWPGYHTHFTPIPPCPLEPKPVIPEDELVALAEAVLEPYSTELPYFLQEDSVERKPFLAVLNAVAGKARSGQY